MYLTIMSAFAVCKCSVIFADEEYQDQYLSMNYIIFGFFTAHLIC